MGKTANQSIANLPENLRPGVSLCFERLEEIGVQLPQNLVEDLTRLIACSEFAGKTLLREAAHFTDDPAALTRTLDAELDNFVDAVTTSDETIEKVKSDFRRFRNRALMRILFRDLQQIADLDETLQQLSLLADRFLDAATRFAEKQLEPRFGRVRNPDGEVVPLVILGMGKLGGRELNFSSDIDLIFCFSEDGQTDGKRRLSAQEYFTRLTRQIIALIDEVTADGFAFRIDTRLRPFGESGPPVVSFAALEAYLLQHGRDWERYAYVKARIVGPQPSATVVEELQDNLIRPFVYRRYLDYGVFESVREMQQMIAAEVRRRDLADNVKLGPGGIREAEFIVQALQLVRGGSESALQSREFQVVLPRLVSARGISADDAEVIRSGYRYLRRIENYIQAIRDEQTHDLPSSETDRARLCLAMRCESWDALVDKLDQHRNAISAQFDAVAFRGQSGDSSKSGVFNRLWESRASAELWEEELTGSHAAALAESIAAFGSSSLTHKIDAVSDERLQRFVPKLLELVLDSDNPVSALSRTLAVTERILRRSAYLALLNENQQALSRLVNLCARSQYIANQIARYPILLDELLDPKIYSEGVTKNDIAGELQQRLGDSPDEDSEAQMQVIAQFQRAAMFRIAVADFNEKLPIMKVSDGLTWLAEVVLAQALRVAWTDLTLRHGTPTYRLDGKTHAAGFAIVAYGKLGGLELSYGSDLDIVFLHDSCGDKQFTDGDKSLDNTMFFARLVRRLVHFLTTQTGSGELYEIDTRLRPDGRSGVLVSSTDAFERYQEENAWTWEHQALLRARAVAGSDAIAQEFERIRRETLANRVRRDELRRDVAKMRRRLRKELERSSKDHFALTHGHGGIGDIEFLVQYLVLLEAGTQPDVMGFSDNIRQLDALVTADILSKDVGERMQEIYKTYRLYQHRLVLDGQKALCAADEFAAEREFVTAVWHEWLG